MEPGFKSICLLALLYMAFTSTFSNVKVKCLKAIYNNLFSTLRTEMGVIQCSVIETEIMIFVWKLPPPSPLSKVILFLQIPIWKKCKTLITSLSWVIWSPWKQAELCPPHVWDTWNHLVKKYTSTSIIKMDQKEIFKAISPIRPSGNGR